MATKTRLLLRIPISKTKITHHHRSLSTVAAPSHHNDHQRNHEYLSPSSYLNSWDPPKDPKQAQWKLDMLRRDYAKKMKSVRKQYIYEMELERIEKQRKDDIKKEALRLESEQRKAAKTAEKKAKAAQRQVAQEEFRQTLLKERAEKLEYHKKREQKFMEKKKEKNELLRRQSSMWIDENELEKKISGAMIDSNYL
uniref:protein enabled homolog n=1 Tax=Erigeron canadensis TaxID=72917 RepID=UPI001CB8AA99|nr:protein enabled homolog [Erigeron canadensis]